MSTKAEKIDRFTKMLVNIAFVTPHRIQSIWSSNQSIHPQRWNPSQKIKLDFRSSDGPPVYVQRHPSISHPTQKKAICGTITNFPCQRNRNEGTRKIDQKIENRDRNEKKRLRKHYIAYCTCPLTKQKETQTKKSYLFFCRNSIRLSGKQNLLFILFF